MARASEIRFDVGTHGKTSAAIYRAPDPIGATLIFAHGAGAPRTHPFIVELGKRIALRGVDVVAFNFLYSEAGRKMPDKVELLETCWRAVIAKVRVKTGFASSPLFIGGKSMGGRMATHVAGTREGLPVAGVVLVGYPLHPNGKPEVMREEILSVEAPLLVVQGTKDELGGATELRRFIAKKVNMRVHPIEGGDHSLAVPKSSTVQPLDEAADVIARFIQKEARHEQRD